MREDSRISLVIVIHSPKILIEQNSTSLPHPYGSQWFLLNISGFLSTWYDISLWSSVVRWHHTTSCGQ